VAEVNLSIDPATVFYIVVEARIYDEKTPVVNPDPASNDSDEAEREILEDQPGDLTAQELRTALENLNVDQKLDLMALTWIGRGDFTIEEWDDARRQAADMRHEHIPRYLMETPLLSDYLEEAMSALGYSLEDYEREHL